MTQKKSNDLDISLLEAARNRILEIKNNSQKPENKNKHLRLSVLGGGCSGFQYKFELDDKINNDDLVISENNNILLAVDKISLDFLHNSSIDYVNEMGGSYFKVNNPNATANCGCGSSFSV